MYSDEVRTIKQGIEAAKDLLDEMSNEALIDNTYGSQLGNAITQLEEAYTEADYIDDQDDIGDIDLEDIKSKSEEIESLADDISRAVRGW